MLRIVTDGATDMPNGWVDDYQINVLPLRVSFGDRTYTQGMNFGLNDFYRLVKETRIIPKTSLPSIGQVKEFYRSVANAGDTILSLHIASKLSGTFSAVQAAASELQDEFRIIPFDSGAGSAAVGFMCREARLMDRENKPLDNIITRLETLRDRLTVIFTLDTLEFAYLNGRINAMQKALTSILNVKPIIILRDGLLEMADRVRTRHRALDKIIQTVSERVGDHPVYVAVVHAADSATAEAMMSRLREVLTIRESIITDLAIPVAANLGPGTIGIVAIPVSGE